MKTLITILTLVLGTSSAALARPITVDHRTDARTFAPPVHDRQYYRQDHAHYRDFNQPLRFRLRPVMLANDVSMLRMRNRDHRPLKIDVDSRMGTFKSIRIDRDQGRMHVESVVVLLPNGRAQTYAVNQVLSMRNPSITIDVHHRAITGIYVYGTTERGRATFDVIGLRR